MTQISEFHMRRDIKYISVEEAMELLHVSRPTLYARINDGTLRAQRTPRKWWVLREDVEKFTPKEEVSW